MDISVFRDADSKYNFFVNEIAASHKTGLFMGFLFENVPRLASDYAHALRAWVALHRSRINDMEVTTLTTDMAASHLG